MASVKIITQAVRDEGLKWIKLHDAMEPIIRAVDGLDLLESAFWIGEPLEINAKINCATYTDFQNAMLTSLRAGAVEFDQIGRVLGKIADEYERHESITELDINKAYSVQP